MSRVSKTYIADIKQIIISARTKLHTSINSIMLETYWLIGKRIVEEELIAEIERQKEILKTQCDNNKL